MPAHRLALCAKDFPPWFRRQVERAIKKFRMVRKDEKVLVAVSGGKDSSAVWHALHTLGYETEGLYLNLGISRKNYSNESLEALEKVASKLGRPLHVVTVENVLGVGIEDVRRYTSRPTCSVCGLVKRYLMNDTAVRLGFHVIATGHNLDDEATMLLHNVLHWQVEYMGRQKPVLQSSEGFVRKIKPLIYLEEFQTTAYCVIERIPFARDDCPFAEGATTIRLKELMYQLEYTSPGTKRRFLDGFLKYQSQLFPESEVHLEIRSCQQCGYPTTTHVCAFCRLKARIEERIKATS